jgi:hypothetical protein
MRTILSFVCLCIVYSGSVFAQGDFKKGYYISVDGDSVPGLVDYRIGLSAHIKAVYKKQNGSQRITFSPEQIRAYGFWNGERYTSMTIPGQRGKVFMAEIVRGHMSLLRYKESFYLEADTLISLQKSTSSPFGFRTVLNSLLASCHLTANGTPYKEKELAYLIQNYNRCSTQPGIHYGTVTSERKMFVQVFSGVDTYSMNVGELPNGTFSKCVSPVFGASFDFAVPWIKDKSFVSLELIYARQKIQGLVEDGTATTFTRTDYSFDISYLKIPVSLRYNFMQEAQTIYLKAGGIHYMVIRSASDMLAEKESNGVVTTEVTYFQQDGSSQFGLWAGIGISKVLFNGKKGFIEYRYETLTGPTVVLGRSRTKDTSANSMSILMGIRF